MYRAKFKKKELAFMLFYNPDKNQISNHLKKIVRNIYAFSFNYGNLILLANFNVEPTELPMKDF